MPNGLNITRSVLRLDLWSLEIGTWNFRDLHNRGRLNILEMHGVELRKVSRVYIADKRDDGIINSVRRIDPNQMSDERSEGLQGGEGDPGRENLLDSFDQAIGSLPPGDPLRRELLQLRPQILDQQETMVEA